MTTATQVALMLVRLTGVVLIVMGISFWSGHALTLIPAHKQVGYLFVLSLWTLVVLAARAGVNPGFVAAVVLWSLVVPVLGLAQDRLLVGDAHWIVKLLHLLVGIVAMGLAERLAARAKDTRVADVRAAAGG